MYDYSFSPLSFLQIARRGNYGAFLLEKPNLLVPLVRKLSALLDIPVSVKVRILPSGVEDSLALYQALVNAGASMITIHGRTRLQKGPLTGRADWNVVKRAVEKFPSIPILCNGSMSNLNEIRECLDYTNAAGIMCSEALLEYPPIFTESLSKEGKRVGPGRLQLSREYLELAKRYPPEQGGQGSGIKCLKTHFHRFLHGEMQSHVDIRDGVTYATSLEDLERVLEKLTEIHEQTGHQVEDEQLSWYVRHRVKEQEEKRKKRAIEEALATFVKDETVDEDAVECNTCFFGNQDDGDY